jgi:hypothetical protein
MERLSNLEWRGFHNLIMWLKHERISREYFIELWRNLQESRNNQRREKECRTLTELY